jgi:nucleoside-diphosphate-sugar epimerase
MAAELLQTSTPANLLFLVRATSPEIGLQRVRDAITKFNLNDTLLNSLSIENIICGDLMDVPQFANDPRLDAVTFVVNSAGMTSFGRNPNVSKINVDGTLKLIHRVAAMPKLRRLIHISTAMICGTNPPDVVSEDLFPQKHSEHFVPYTESKAEAERQIREVMKELPFAIVRPTIIVGHTKLGCAPSNSIFWAFRMGDALRMTTASLEDRIDVVPVDYVASAVLHLLARPELKHTIYHVGSGAASSNNFSEIDHAFCRALDRQPGDYRAATVEEALARKEEYQELFGNCSKRFMQGAVKLYGNFAALNAVFDISRLQKEGAPAPPRFADYLGVCSLTSIHISIAEQAMTDFL